MTHDSTVSRTTAGVRSLLCGAGLVFAASLVASAVAQTPAQPTQSQAQAPAAADAKAEEEFIQAAEQTIEGVCRMCHPIENILRLRRTSREWTDQITTMAGRGANATEEQFAMIHKYLTRYYGRVRINSAPAEEVSAVLGLSAKDAAALVEYRKAHGPFADVAAVLKIDGIDKTKIEEQPEALVFD